MVYQNRRTDVERLGATRRRHLVQMFETDRSHLYGDLTYPVMNKPATGLADHPRRVSAGDIDPSMLSPPPPNQREDGRVDRRPHEPAEAAAAQRRRGWRDGRAPPGRHPDPQRPARGAR